MDEKDYQINGTTPTGSCLFAHVKTPEIIRRSDGTSVATDMFSILLSLEDADAQAFLDEIDKAWNSFSHTLKDKEFNLQEYRKPMRKIKDKEYFRFRKKAYMQAANQTDMIYTSVPIYDSNNNSCGKFVQGIGNGSEIKIAYTIIPYYMNAAEYGVSLRLRGIQLIKLMPIVTTGDRYGFEKVENGFVADDEFRKAAASPLNDQEIPF